MAHASLETMRVTESATDRVRSGALGPAVLAALVLAAAVYFRPGLEALLTAWRLPEYSHGPLIPLLSSLLFLRQLRADPARPGPVEDRWPGVVAIALALLLGAVGRFARIGDIVAYAIIVFVAGVILVSFGWRRGRRFWPGVVHLAFMLPLPGILYWKVSTNLQLFSSEVGVALIRLAGVPVFLDGNIIDLGPYKLHVAEACSGLRYLYPIMSFSYIFAALYRGPVWHKAVLLLSAAPIAVMMNSLRIGLIGVMVDRFGIAHAEGLSHLLEGWVIFLASVLALFGLVTLMLRLQGSRTGLAEALDLDFDGVGAQFARLRLVRPSAALVAALTLTGGAAAAWTLAPQGAAVVIERAALDLFPARLGEWRRTGVDRLEPEIARALGADDYHAARFARAGAPEIDFFVAWYHDQTQGGIHSPEVCLPGGGWEMERIERVDLAGPLGLDETLPVNRAIIQKGEARLLVYYWFEQYGGRTASDYLAKVELLRSALVHGRSDGALVRVLTPILPGEGAEAAEARLLDFTREALGELPRFVPQRG